MRPTRRDIGRLSLSLLGSGTYVGLAIPLAARAAFPGRSLSMPVGIRLPLAPGRSTVDTLLADCAALAVDVVDIDLRAVEIAAGSPVLPETAEVPSGVSSGHVEIEEEVLRDAYDLARRTFEENLRKWRVSDGARVTQPVAKRFAGAGVSVTSVSCPDLIAWDADDTRYAFTIARTFGATLATRLVMSGERILTAAGAGGSTVAFWIEADAPLATLDRVLRNHAAARAILSVPPRTVLDDALLAFAERHADRIAQLRVHASADGSITGAERGLGVLAGRAGLSCPAIVVLDQTGGTANPLETTARAVESCRRTLGTG